MSKPIPGKQYVVQVGDTLESIASQAYGDPKLSSLIVKANISAARTAAFAFVDGVNIFPGQVLNIPIKPISNQAFVVPPKKLTNKQPDDLTILIDGLELQVESANIAKRIDAGAFGWVVTIQWEPGADPELDRRLRPYAYSPAEVYIGNDLIIGGFVYTVAPDFGKRKEMRIDGWSPTADIIDSNLQPPYEAAQITLRQRAEEVVQPFGLNVIYDVNEDELFDRVTAKPTEKVFAHLTKLAAQRGILVTTTPIGDVRFVRAATGPIVASLVEGQSPALEWSAEYNGRLRFSHYRAIGQSPGNSAKSATSQDTGVPRTRFKTFNANDATDGNIQTSADWKRSKQLANSLATELPVEGWLTPDGDLWRENTLVTVVAPSLFLSDGFTFLLRGVEFDLSPTKGKTTILSLVPPQAYTGEPIPEVWK